MEPTTMVKRRGGLSSAALLAFALLLAAGCRDATRVTDPVDTSGTAAPPPTTPTVSVPLIISGAMTSRYQSIRVSRGGAAITDAIVTVNGFPMSYCCGDLYNGSLPEDVPAGSTLNLKVIAGGVSFEATGAVIAKPTITAPAAGSAFAWTESVNLVWSSPTDPDQFEVCLNCWANSLDGAIYPASGSARAFTIAPGFLVDYGGGTIVVVTARKGNFLKPDSSAEVLSNIVFIARSSEAVITIKH